jgi:hypothetical protein
MHYHYYSLNEQIQLFDLELQILFRLDIEKKDYSHNIIFQFDIETKRCILVKCDGKTKHRPSIFQL